MQEFRKKLMSRFKETSRPNDGWKDGRTDHIL